MQSSWGPWTKGSDCVLKESSTEIQLFLKGFDNFMREKKFGLNWNLLIVYLTNTEDRAKTWLFMNTRYPKYPMILKKNRVRIGYCQKLSGRVGYRVPVRHWSIVGTQYWAMIKLVWKFYERNAPNIREGNLKAFTLILNISITLT